MDDSTVIDYPHLPAERLEYWQKRSAIDIGMQHLLWKRGKRGSKTLTPQVGRFADPQDA